MKHRFFHPESAGKGARISFQGEELHHAARVRRLRVGEEIEVFDGRGWHVVAGVEMVDRNTLSAIVGDAVPGSRESTLGITLAIALIQPDRFEMVLQKGTELGVLRFIPLVTDRTEVPLERVRGRVDRWMKLLLEATKQCGRSIVPTVSKPMGFREIPELSSGSTIVFDAEVPPDPLPERLERTCLLIGPEGGWSADEIRHAKASGALFQRLGPRRLRAETAAIGALVAVGLRFGDLS